MRRQKGWSGLARLQRPNEVGEAPFVTFQMGLATSAQALTTLSGGKSANAPSKTAKGQSLVFCPLFLSEILSSFLKHSPSISVSQHHFLPSTCHNLKLSCSLKFFCLLIISFLNWLYISWGKGPGLCHSPCNLALGLMPATRPYSIRGCRETNSLPTPYLFSPAYEDSDHQSRAPSQPAVATVGPTTVCVAWVGSIPSPFPEAGPDGMRPVIAFSWHSVEVGAGKHGALGASGSHLAPMR